MMNFDQSESIFSCNHLLQWKGYMGLCSGKEGIISAFMTPAWPDVGIKSKPIFQVVAQEVTKAVFS